MLHHYSISGMHCAGCAEKIRSALSVLPNIELVQVNLQSSEATITMKQHVPVEAMNAALSKIGDYSLTEANHSHVTISPSLPTNTDEEIKLAAYYPLFLVFAFLIGITTITTMTSDMSGGLSWMSNFMGGFFLSFSFFKLLDLKGFAASYFSYDIITKRWFAFGYIYPFIELLLGVGYLLVPMNLALNVTTAVVMSVSSIGVIQSVMNKRKIKCACLGTVFNLPMGTITIIEDSLMIVMSVLMIVSTFAA